MTFADLVGGESIFLASNDSDFDRVPGLVRYAPV
jgi:hypothetical protein